MASALRRRSTRASGRVTMDEVARLAQVSTSTVSRVLRHPAIVSPELAAKVQAAVERLGYLPNFMAGGLATASTRQIGVVVPSITNAFFSATLDALTDRLTQGGYQVLLGTSSYDETREEALIESFLAWSPAAIVLTGLRHARRATRLLLDARVPVIEMWEIGPAPLDIMVGFSHRAVGGAMTRHLIRSGRRRIGFIGAYLDHDRRADMRRQGYAEAVREAGLHAELTEAPPDRSSVATGAAALGRLIEREPGIDAVFCQNDILALGALFEAQRRGLAVPGRLAIGGFGDMDFAGVAVPPLTTVRPPAREIGARAAEILLDRFACREPLERVIDLGFELIRRESA